MTATYALASAEFAVAAADTSPALILARAFAAGGAHAVRTTGEISRKGEGSAAVAASMR